ncbi:cysteine hydrolase family protein [Lawsonibacter faecis]|uniref:Cysteine hydrolase n=1 Tax=Lawsonibacter faecis TaxID=2763052 RepID=A0A8J6JI59_9FIRM|nr:MULTISPECIES: isochorismatase family cysteine hydrolase [Oscillospiraceae]MTQ96063.1 isochorismatase family protein [Pseudoflavonifractor sp. BIOML-A16]MTR04815.1 isochorismatase family protein [Pseudoflavonifractor sp. BIOML-A15]MTR30937.1 isochorismatase family protein [Pseudoflavonifractor sp. BIOML-A14]MTR71502.1 isochorismatase family protein [Pseudoflavonifractor sp. BIOML-A18]MTS62955.1 isochorismatase family protein [Pseudoflavonifractor sp. BIOML-A5]MTS71451.1 isochorismatase fami
MKLLIVIDMQNDFIDGALGTAEAVKIVPAVADKLAARRSEGWKVLFTRDTHGADYLDTQEGRRLSVPHCIWGTEGWQITSSLDVGDAALVDKPTFGSLDLAEAAANLGEPEEIELVGLCTDICVISNAMILKARFPEARVLVDAACCAGVTPESHENALKAMRGCQVDVI